MVGGGAEGMVPKGGLSKHLSGGAVLCSTENRKEFEKNTQKHTRKMLVIGRLGAHASSGEDHWVEGAEGRAGQRREA